jgi:hypothetical protein
MLNAIERMMDRPEVVKKLVSLPTDVKNWLTQEAERNLSTANSEIVRALRAAMREKQQREKAAR